MCEDRLLLSFMGPLHRTRSETVSALTQVLLCFWCIFPSLLRNSRDCRNSLPLESIHYFLLLTPYLKYANVIAKTIADLFWKPHSWIYIFASRGSVPNPLSWFTRERLWSLRLDILYAVIYLWPRLWIRNCPRFLGEDVFRIWMVLCNVPNIYPGTLSL